MVRRSRCGFTLVEILVVITIIGVLIGIAVPSLLAVQKYAKRTQCQTNQGQLAKAIVSRETRKGYPGYLEIHTIPSTGQNVAFGWPILMLSDINRQDLWMQYRSATDKTTLQTRLANAPALAEYRCPADSRAGAVLSYAANCGRLDSGSPPDSAANAVFHDLTVAKQYQVQMRSSDIKDGTTTTILFTENTERPDNTNPAWPMWSAFGATATEANLGTLWLDCSSGGGGFYVPSVTINDTVTSSNSAEQRARPSSPHGGGVIVSFCDGHQRFIRETINYVIFARLMAPCDSGVVTPPGNSGKKPTIMGSSDWTRAIREDEF